MVPPASLCRAFYLDDVRWLRFNFECGMHYLASYIFIDCR
jgi:hypothetical protein